MALKSRTLSEQEVAVLFPKRGQMDLSEYEAMFSQGARGYEVELNGLSVRALKRRLGQAAKRVLGSSTSLRYKHSEERDDVLRVLVRPEASTKVEDQPE